eukprot:TRINITY_DN40_c0_g1_i1.p1 TRINITY_DN40_c0_g1~~TRINITY_DN40_c0_g1_i1.p1  ORF type:complete len:243 (-),score=32.60 TRINITY_DN40_c0_g1_i1:54-782(-)
MCFNQPMSLTFALMGLAVAAYVYIVKKNTSMAIGIMYFFGMEFLQFWQYFFIDDCESMVNRVLTYVGFLHICFQPYFTHMMSSSFSKGNSRRVWNFTMRLCLIAGFYIVFSSAMAPWSPRPSTEETPSFDWLRGKRLCTYSGVYHLAWSVPLYEPTYFMPNLFLHFFVMFAPFFAWGSLFMALQGAILFATGPLLSSYITPNLHEQASIWCFFSIMQVTVMVAFAYWKSPAIQREAQKKKKN